MDQYIPPLVAVSTATVIVLLCFVLRIPFFIVGVLSVAMVAYVLQDHIIRFSSQYSSASIPDFFKQNASIFIITLVILLSLGFLLFSFGPKAIISNERTRYDARQPQSRTSGLFDSFGKMFGRSSSSSQRDPYASSSAYDKYV
jgi:hypothetical protein